MNEAREHSMQPIDKAIAILERTQDGNLLAVRDLKLTELAAKNGLSDLGLTSLGVLYDEVVAGTYDASKLYLFGIEHLTRDAEGYVFWKGVHVEHYSHKSPEEMERDARKLAATCQALEAKNFPVNSRTAIDSKFEQAPPETQWLEAMCRYYTLFEGQGRHVAIFYRYSTPEVVILEKDVASGQVRRTPMDSAYGAYHHVQDQGLKSGSPFNDYGEFVSWLQASGLTPRDIHQGVRSLDASELVKEGNPDVDDRARERG